MLHTSAGDLQFQPPGPAIGQSVRRAASPNVECRIIDDPSMIVVSKSGPGFDDDEIEWLRALLRDVESGRTACQYIVFELDGGADPHAPAALDDFLREVSELIVKMPVITVAWARGTLCGADLEVAFACSMLVSEHQACFSFDLDLVTSLQTYATLAHKLGFVRAERLMENGTLLNTDQMNDLLLANPLVPPEGGFDAMQEFLRGRSRRHNAACGIYRAQRLAMAGRRTAA